MSGGSIPSIEIGQVWSFCRDNLRGTTPLAQAQIECLQRDYVAPSKAHIKRLKKVRPLVLKAKPRAWSVPSPDVVSFNDAKRISREVVRMASRVAHNLPPIQAPKPVEQVRFDYTRNASVPKSDDDWNPDVIQAKIDKLAREAAAARAAADGVKNA